MGNAARSAAKSAKSNGSWRSTSPNNDMQRRRTALTLTLTLNRRN
jgi:hypothetical protein